MQGGISSSLAHADQLFRRVRETAAQLAADAADLNYRIQFLPVEEQEKYKAGLQHSAAHVQEASRHGYAIQHGNNANR
jgi:N-acetyl-beta-hexosaminidase